MFLNKNIIFQESTSDAVFKFLESLGLFPHQVSVQGILDVVRSISQNISNEANNNNLCDNYSSDSDNIIITYFIELLSVENKNDLLYASESQWVSYEMLMDFKTVNLLGPDPLVFFRYVESEQFTLAPLNIIEDVFWNCHVQEIFENNSNNTILSNSTETNEKAIYPLKLFHLEHLKKVNSKVSSFLQETLVKAAAIDESEISLLRRMFYANSFPSRFINCDTFCKKLCKPVLGEANRLMQQDYFRYDLYFMFIKIGNICIN